MTKKSVIIKRFKIPRTPKITISATFQPGKSWVVLTDGEDDSLAGLPLYITAGNDKPLDV